MKSSLFDGSRSAIDINGCWKLFGTRRNINYWFLTSKTNVVLFLIFITFLLAGDIHSAENETCFCPQESKAWTVFPDSAHYLPDVFHQKPVKIREIRLCCHGINFYFKSKQDGNKHLTCFILKAPTLNHYLQDIPADSSWSDSAIQNAVDRFDYSLFCYQGVLNNLETLFNVVLRERAPMCFDTGWFAKSPKMTFRREIILTHDGQDLALRGNINIYFKADNSEKENTQN